MDLSASLVPHGALPSPQRLALVARQYHVPVPSTLQRMRARECRNATHVRSEPNPAPCDTRLVFTWRCRIIDCPFDTDIERRCTTADRSITASYLLTATAATRLIAATRSDQLSTPAEHGHVVCESCIDCVCDVDCEGSDLCAAMDVVKEKLSGREEFEEEEITSRRCMLDGTFRMTRSRVLTQKYAFRFSDL